MKITSIIKKLPFSVKNIAESFKLPILKGEIDYYKYRSENHIMTEEERKYIKNGTKTVLRKTENKRKKTKRNSSKKK